MFIKQSKWLIFSSFVSALKHAVLSLGLYIVCILLSPFHVTSMKLFCTPQVKQLDENLPSELEEIINKYHQEETDGKLDKENASVLAESLTRDQGSSLHSSDSQEVGLVLF